MPKERKATHRSSHNPCVQLLNPKVQNPAHKIRHVYDVHFAEVAEVVTPDKLGGRKLHSGQVQIVTMEEVFVLTVDTAKTGVKALRDFCHTKDSDVFG
jgi:hypothetical protein